MQKVTESDSLYSNIEQKSTLEILTEINQEDFKVAKAVQDNIDSIHKLVDQVVLQLLSGGRLFYLGAGTSGRLGILDASECPPTFGVDHGLVIGLIAGGDQAIRKAVENAEDNKSQAWIDLKGFNVNSNDFVIGIAASGTTPYVLGGLDDCKKKSIPTGCIVCNPGSPIGKAADYPIEVVIGPEYITGSTRMKAGTAQKLVLNMISTATMIKLGRVLDNKMVDMQLSNDKLVDRGTKLIAKAKNLSYDEAKKLLVKFGSVRKVLENQVI